jgi:hypothetical protein
VAFCKLYAEEVFRFLTNVNSPHAAQQSECQWRASASRDAGSGFTIA